MSSELSSFAARLRAAIAAGFHHQDFDALAVELFHLQFAHCAPYRDLCRARRVEPASISVLRQTTPEAMRWHGIPFVPTSAFKALEFSSIPVADRTAVFHSSGTTTQTPGRHFHHAESLTLYETSLWAGFHPRFCGTDELLLLTPPPASVPHSSLVHMFETVRRNHGASAAAFTGQLSTEGAWTLDLAATRTRLESAADAETPLTVMGTAFSFLQLLDFLAEKNLRLQLPDGSRVMETGGYKNRLRTLPKSDLHQLLTERLGVPRDNIICEYGMCELSSQAYDVTSGERPGGRGADPSRITHHASRILHFPPWARAQIISPETGREVGEGQTGLLRVLDLANVFSEAAIQTEDLGIRRGDGFELIGRSPSAEPRGCSLNSPESSRN